MSSSQLFCSTNRLHHTQLTTHSIPLSLQKIKSQYIFCLNMATAMFPEQFDNLQHSMLLIPKNQTLCTELQSQDHPTDKNSGDDSGRDTSTSEV
jgi:hypothetical protein